MRTQERCGELLFVECLRHSIGSLLMHVHIYDRDGRLVGYWSLAHQHAEGFELTDAIWKCLGELGFLVSSR